MSKMQRACLVSYLYLFANVLALDCSIPPIYVDIHYRQVDGSGIDEYGTFMGIGSPSQNQSLWPALNQNETTLASVTFCSQGSSSTCRNMSHSIFVPELSTTWVNTPNYTPLDKVAPTEVTAQLGNDTLRIFSHYFDPSPPALTSISSFPATLLSAYTSPNSPFFGPAGLVGLGPSSTVLTHLSNLGLIASRSYGLYLGTAYPRAGGAINGSLVLGGYDAGRFEDPVHHYNMSSADQTLNVHVSQMTLSTASTDGSATDSTIELLNSTDTGFDAEITTSQYSLTLPQSITQSLATTLAASSSSNSDGENTLQAARRYTGTLTITLSDGFSITFPPEWLTNASNITPISSDPLTTAPSTFLLGTSFLSAIYLTTNYDSTPPTFHLAKALPSAAYVYNQTLCANAAPTPYTTPQVSGFAKTGAAGAIVGGVIGGIAFSLLAWVFVQKCLRRRAERKRVLAAQKGKSAALDLEGWEMGGRQQPPVQAEQPQWPLSNVARGHGVR